MPSIAFKRGTHLQLVKPASFEPETIDVSSLLDRIEDGLRAPASTGQSRVALSLLRSWAWNDMIQDTCQERARSLLLEFDSHH